MDTNTTVELTQVRVSMDSLGDDDVFTAWTDGDRWNGWEVPSFEKAEADRVIAALAHAGWDWLFASEHGTSWGTYDADRDAYVIWDGNAPIAHQQYGMAPYEGEVYVGYDLPNGAHVYDIGAREWCWWNMDAEYA